MIFFVCISLANQLYLFATQTRLLFWVKCLHCITLENNHAPSSVDFFTLNTSIHTPLEIPV